MASTQEGLGPTINYVVVSKPLSYRLAAFGKAGGVFIFILANQGSVGGDSAVPDAMGAYLNKGHY